MNALGFTERLVSPTAPTGVADFLVLEATPNPWAMAATSIQTILTTATWSGRALNLDELLELPAVHDGLSHVIVVVDPAGELALFTGHHLHLEAFSLSDLVPIPLWVFRRRLGRPKAKCLILRDGPAPLMLLDLDAIREMEQLRAQGQFALTTVGDPLL